MRRWRRFAVILTTLAAALLSAGCSDGDAPPEAETASPPA